MQDNNTTDTIALQQTVKQDQQQPLTRPQPQQAQSPQDLIGPVVLHKEPQPPINMGAPIIDLAQITERTTTDTTKTTTTTTTTTSSTPTNDNNNNNSQDDDMLNSAGPGKLKKPKRKRKMDGNRPKNKMITGYIIYASEIRKEIIKKFPKKDFGDISKIVGIEWKSLSQEAKVAFEKRAQEQNNQSKMLNEKAEAALELMKLADTAVTRDLEHPNLPVQIQQEQQQQLQQQQPPPPPPPPQQQQQQQLSPSAPSPHASFIYPVEQQQHHLYHPHHLSDQQQVALLLQQHQQQQTHHQQQQPLPLNPNNSCDVPPQVTQLTSTSGQGVDNNNNNTTNTNNNNNCHIRTPTPGLSQHPQQEPSFAHQFHQQSAQQPPLSITPNYPFSAQSTPPVQNYFYNYSQPPNMYPQFMSQSTPILMRPNSASSSSLNSNDASNNIQQQQQQQPMHIIQQQQQQQQQPQSQQMPTMVQYCNGSCCFVNGRSPYPVATTPNVMSSPYYHTPPLAYQPSQFPQQATTPTLPTTPVQQPRRNNIIYRKPAIVRLRPKDASTQTDPVNWVEKIKSEEPKKILKHSKEFIEHFNRKVINSNNNNNHDNNDNDDNTVELDVNLEHH